MTKRKTPFPTREQWLQAFTKRASPIFKKAGYDIPENIRMAVGFTSSGARGKRIGECWQADASEDGAVEIFIDPQLGDASRVADILTHELIHATGIRGHRADFSRCMEAVGLIGKPTATIAGPDWHAWADKVIADLGPLPHAAIVPSKVKPKQTTRMIKCECEVCGFTFRTSAKWLETGADLGCPDRDCGADLVIG